MKAIILFVILALMGASTAMAADANNGGTLCPEGEIKTTYQAPPPGMASFQNIFLDENCRVIMGPVQTVPIDQLPTYMNDPEAVGSEFPPLNNATTNKGTRASRTLYAEQVLLDPVNIPLNHVYGSIQFNYNGSSITSYTSSGGYLSHSESLCGPGWAGYNPKNVVKNIGAVNSFVAFKHQTSFSYQGVFDCGGTIYNNKLQNFPKVFGDGSGQCTFKLDYRTWSSLWHTTTACYFTF